MLFIYFILTVSCTISFGKSKLTCDNKDVAREKFEYYTPWYRFKNGILFRIIRKICVLTEEESKFVCAQVAQACFSTLKEVPVEVIEKEIETTPGHCKKEEYTTPKKNGDFKSGRKKMFPCPRYTVAGQLVSSFFVSYGGSDGTALIFDRESTKHLNIDEEPPNERGTNSFIKLAHYVTGLQFGRSQNENNQNKHNQNVNAQSKSDENKDTQVESGQKKDIQNTENHHIDNLTT